MTSILVLGGTGFVGAHLCEKLVRAGCQVTVPTRRLARATAIQTLPRLQPVQADIHDPAALARLLPGHDAVVNLVAILHGDEAAFERTHVTLPATLAAACRGAGVRRLVHISALGADAAGPSRYQRSKARGEAVLQDAARAGALDLTVLRPGVIFGAGDRFLNLFAGLQRLAPVLPLAGAACRFQPVWVEDVAEAIVRCLDNPRTAGTTFELAGPDVLTLAELVRGAARWSGAPLRPIVPLPSPLARAQAWLMERAPGEPLMSRDNLDSMQADNVARGAAPGLADLGITAASLAAVAPTYLGHRGPRSGLDERRRTRA
jgi:NADH dehydrogenase